MPFTKLAALGVSLSPGAMTFDLTTVPGGDLAKITSNDPAVRVGVLDWTKPGSMTMQRFSFTLTRVRIPIGPR